MSIANKKNVALKHQRVSPPKAISSRGPWEQHLSYRLLVHLINILQSQFDISFLHLKIKSNLLGIEVPHVGDPTNCVNKHIWNVLHFNIMRIHNNPLMKANLLTSVFSNLKGITSVWFDINVHPLYTQLSWKLKKYFKHAQGRSCPWARAAPHIIGGI